MRISCGLPDGRLPSSRLGRALCLSLECPNSVWHRPLRTSPNGPSPRSQGSLVRDAAEMPSNPSKSLGASGRFGAGSPVPTDPWRPAGRAPLPSPTQLVGPDAAARQTDPGWPPRAPKCTQPRTWMGRKTPAPIGSSVSADTLKLFHVPEHGAPVSRNLALCARPAMSPR